MPRDLWTWLIPKRLMRNAEDFARMRLVLWMALVFLIPLLLYIPVYFYYGNPSGAWVLLSMAPIPFTVPITVRLASSSRVPAHVVCGCILYCETLLAVTGGGMAAPSLPWFLLVPLTATVLIGFSASLAWCVLTVAVLVAIFWADSNEFLPTSPDSVLNSAPLMALISLLGAVPVVTILGGVFERNRTQSLRILADRTREQARLNTQLSEEIGERTRVEQELRQAKDQAEKATAAKSLFLANVSHEVRTPLNGLIGMTQMLSESALTTDQRDCVNVITRSGTALLHIINDILDISKIEAGKIDLEDIALDLRELVEEAAELVALRAEAKGLSLAAYYDPAAPRNVIGDPLRLRQIITNLADNAVKFTSKGHVRIFVRPDGIHDGLATFQLAVADTGIGLSPEQIDLLFREFSQADESTTRKFGGTGLGLAIIKGLAAQMGGECGVNSAPGEGSTFWVRVSLPLQPGEIVSTRDSTVPDAPRAIVFDGDPVQTDVLARYLKHWGVAYQLLPYSEGVPPDPARLNAILKEGCDFAVAVEPVSLSPGQGAALPVALVSQLGGKPVLVVAPMGRCATVLDVFPARNVASLATPLRYTSLKKTIMRLLKHEEAPGEPIAGGSSDADAATAGTARFMGLRVLVVEDNEVNQLVAKRMLERLGCDTVIVDNGQKAVDALANHLYDAVFMDCQMPVMDGYQAAAAIRKLEGEARAVPIIAMTAHAQKEDEIRCREAGMNDYLTKPVSRESITNVLLKHVAPTWSV